MAREQTADMYMQDKLGNAGGIIYIIALAVVVVIAAWNLIVRWNWLLPVANPTWLRHNGAEIEVNSGLMVRAMIDEALVASIAQQVMASDKVNVNGELVPVSRTSKNRLRTLAFSMDGREYQAIEQNAEKPSRWGQLAREGHQVVQFKTRQPTDSWQFVSMGSWRSMGLGTENNRGAAAQSLATVLLKFLQRRCFLEALVALHGVKFAGEILDWALLSAHSSQEETEQRQNHDDAEYNRNR
jgi:hypothetical protein